jgi:hypothetical protein
MRLAFAHEATVVTAPNGDDGAPGAAITVALCGHWEHEPPCPLAPHHTRAERVGDELRLRTLFVVEPELEDKVRQRIEAALAEGRLVGSGDVVTTWRLLTSKPADVVTAEHDHAERLLQS